MEKAFAEPSAKEPFAEPFANEPFAEQFADEPFAEHSSEEPFSEPFAEDFFLSLLAWKILEIMRTPVDVSEYFGGHQYSSDSSIFHTKTIELIRSPTSVGKTFANDNVSGFQIHITEKSLKSFETGRVL